MESVMAWAERLPSGKWRGSYRDGAGKIRSAGTFTHKAKAVREANAIELTARKKLWQDPESYKLPWSSWADEWATTRQVETSTARADRIRRAKHLDPRWGDVPIGSITRHDVQAWASSLLSSGMSPSTAQRAVHLLSASLSAAVDADIIDVNPAARVKLPKGGQAIERFLSHDEFNAIYANLPTRRDQLIAEMLVNTGMRWSELAGLHWDRVNLKQGRVRVAETYDENARRMKPYPKGRSVRDVPLTSELVEQLVELQPAGESCGIEHTAGQCRSPLVLTTERGNPIRNSNWSAVWRNAVEDAEVADTRIHDWRHTYASWLAQAGIPIAEIGRLLGHASPQTTQRYAHLAEPPNDAVLAALQR